MKRLSALVFAITITAAMSWAQAGAQPQGTPTGSAPAASAPTPQAAGGAQAASQQGATQPGATGASQTGASSAQSSLSSISGCMQRGFATYQVHDAATGATYDLRGNGANLANFENKVVQIQGITDPQAKSGNAVVYYVQNIKDSGQSCGTAGQSAATTQPGTTATGNQPSSQSQNVGAASATAPGATASQGSAAGAAQPAPSNTTGGTPSSSPGAATTQPTQPTPPNMQSQSAGAPSTGASTSSQASAGTAPGAATAATPQPGTPATPEAQTAQSNSSSTIDQGQPTGGMENKGTPEAGTPQTGAVAAPSGTSAATGSAGNQQSGQAFQGCVHGDPNNLKFKANSKEYRLQGNTQQVATLVGHQVEITGENFNDKAIQVNAVRDLGSNCSK